MISVLTPTYNRGYIISKAYESLVNQTDLDFEWIVVDDGSSDDTESIIKKFINDNKIKIKYIKKENGGKHSAINLGVKKAKGEYVLILDSDDIFLPNAISDVKKYWKEYKNNDNVGVLSFLRVFPNNKKIGTPMKEDIVISDNIEYRYNKNVKGDMSESYRKEILLNNPFPIYENERFLSEAIIWNKIALDYKTVFINKAICMCDYLTDGLSKNFLKLVYNNPLGALNNANMFLIKKFKLKIRLKNAILYTGYNIAASKKYNKKIDIKCNDLFLTIILYPLGMLFYHYLRKKGE